MEELRQAKVFGVRPSRTFEEAAVKFVIEDQHKLTIENDISRLKGRMPWIGNVRLDRLHRVTLEPWIECLRKQGRAGGTIIHDLQIVRRIINLAAGE